MQKLPPAFSLYEGDLARLLGKNVGLIVTPNLDHLRLLRASKAFRRAYRQADVVLNDSRFLDKLFVCGRSLCMPGSELAPMILNGLDKGSKIAIIGGDPSVHQFLREACPGADFRFFEPTMGYIAKRLERRRLAQSILSLAIDKIFICTGAPQSELLAAQLKRAGCTADMLCCGSAFHFLSGSKQRAPMPIQRAGMEWLWRFLTEPHTRKRYFADALFLIRRAPVFFSLRGAGIGNFGTFKLIIKSAAL